MTIRKPVAPFYAAAVVWLAYALIFPLYAPAHYAVVGVISALVFVIVSLLCRTGAPKEAAENAAKAAAAKKAKAEAEKPTGNPELDKMLKDGRLAIAEMKRLDENIADEGISADIVRLEEISGKIFAQVKDDAGKLPQIRRFMDYYLPTTLKLLNAYDRASSAGISGENVTATMTRVETMLKTIVKAFEKQLDSLFGDEALDISTDITVLENLMAQEGLTGDQLHAQTMPKDDTDIKLDL
jgi:5-bromo-4-chloroindolyl phosphate hydrolysis protein